MAAITDTAFPRVRSPFDPLYTYRHIVCLVIGSDGARHASPQAPSFDLSATSFAREVAQ
jgi:hypothetical protein